MLVQHGHHFQSLHDYYPVTSQSKIPSNHDNCRGYISFNSLSWITWSIISSLTLLEIICLMAVKQKVSFTQWRGLFFLLYRLPCQLRLVNTPIATLQRVKTSPNEFPGYDFKQSDGGAPVMQELWGMQSTPSLPSFTGPLWPAVVAPDRVLSMGQIKLNCNYIKLNCLKLTLFLHLTKCLNCVLMLNWFF